MSTVGTLAKAGWLLIALAGVGTLIALSSISWSLTTQSNAVMTNAYIDDESDPALARFKSGDTGAENPNVDFFVYSVTNAEDVLTGAKPRLEAIGPFQYAQTSEVDGDVVVKDGFTTFSASKKYQVRGSAEDVETMLKREVVVPNMFHKEQFESGVSDSPLFIKVTAGQVLGSTSVNWKDGPVAERQMTFADFGGLGASEQKNVRMKTGQRFKAKGFRYIVQDEVSQYCAFDADCEAVYQYDTCTEGGTCSPLKAEGFELQASAPAELFAYQGSDHHGIGNKITQWVGKPVPPISFTNIQAAEMETGNARGVIMESSTQVYHWVVSDFSSRRENCLDQEGHPAGSPGMDCSSPQKSISIAPWANQLPIYVSFHKFGAASKYDSILRQFGRSEADKEKTFGRKPARTLVGPVAQKSFAVKGAYDPVTKVDLSEVPDFAEPASFKSEVHSGEILRWSSRSCSPSGFPARSTRR
jgi:hypothetical protein